MFESVRADEWNKGRREVRLRWRESQGVRGASMGNLSGMWRIGGWVSENRTVGVV